MRRAISLPVGGIGTGTIGIGGRGQLRDWEVQNHPAKGSLAPGTFLAVRAAGTGVVPQARVLEGDLFPEEYEGALGSPAPQAGLPRFSRCAFEAAYPLARVRLEDDHFPLSAIIEVFNPMVPGDLASSSLPLAIWRVLLRNNSEHPLETSLMLSVANFIGARLRHDGRDDSRPVARTKSAPGLQGVLLHETAFDDDDMTITFSPSPSRARWPWFSGTAWGTITQTVAEGTREVRLEVRHGTLLVERLIVGHHAGHITATGALGPGQIAEVTLPG